jgi:hypothetical protein
MNPGFMIYRATAFPRDRTGFSSISNAQDDDHAFTGRFH